MDIIYFLINSICQLLYKKEYKKFIKTKDVKSVQMKKLFEIIDKNKTSVYGRRYSFENINDYSDFSKIVPVTTYEDYSPYIDKICKGEKNMLTSEDVLLLELTSGSVSSKKLIPYTKSLKEEFQKGIKPWIYDLYSNCRGVKWGKSYWSITPITSERKYTAAGIPIGFEEDTEYFGAVEKKLFDLVFAVDSSVKFFNDMESFYFRTCLSLLKCKSLTLISVWNPTFMLLIINYMMANSDKLIAALPTRRAKKLTPFLENGDFSKIFTRLKVISCWCDANADSYAKILGEIFPNTIIQPKGLLATEGFVSFPLLYESGARLSIYSHFFEFVNTSDGKIYLADELKENNQYEVLITTSGGFYRYSLKDLMEVKKAEAGEIPLIRFVGKKDNTSDLFGEKLNELFIKRSIDELNIENEFYIVAPDENNYVLYIKTSGKSYGKIDSNLAKKENAKCNYKTCKKLSEDLIDNKLRESFHYDYCRSLGQLKKIKIFLVTGNPREDYINECLKNGQRLGDIKQTVLSLKNGWDKIFRGEFL